MIRPLRVMVALSLCSLVAVGCGDDGSSTGGGDEPAGSITVFAAASLTAAFTELGQAFEVDHPEAQVTFNFAASSELASQINQGAPADVFASADETNMDRLVEGIGTVEEPAVFATNKLQIIVEPGNPLGIADLADVADPDLIFVTAAPEVPIGRYTLEVLDAAGVDVTPRSFEQSVSGVVSKVVLGEADAGIVYATDVLRAGDDADGVDIPADINVVARYPIAVPADGSNVVTAQAFIDFVLSDAGQAILESYGFTSP